VQICLGLLRPYRVLLCDEITVDLDVVARVDLLNFFRRETDERGATIIYATHIFDGMEAWPTHVAYVERGMLKRAGRVEDVPVRARAHAGHVCGGHMRDAACADHGDASACAAGLVHGAQEMFGPGEVDGKSRLLASMEALLRTERDDRIANGTPAPGKKLSTPSPFANSKHMAYFR
jgi:ABC-type multidrug transport system ATPase subunit